jgi:hypothetical protein
MARQNPYAMDPALQRGISNLSRALLGSASDDAAIARGRYYDAQAEGQRQANEFDRKRYQGIDEASVPTGILAQKLIEGWGLQLDQGGNLTKMLPEGSPQMSVPALPNQTQFSQDQINAQLGGLARSFFGDGKYNPDQFSKAVGNLGDNAIASIARSMIMNPEATDEMIRRAGMLLNQNQAVTERGQDIKSSDTQRGQDIRSTDTQRGQDINAQTTQRGQDIRSSDTQRGQDIRSTDTKRGQDIRSTDTQRGQDINAQTTQRGQDIRSSDTQRGQDIRSTDTQRGQDIRSTDTQRGQDISSTDTQRGQDIRSSDTQRGQDIRSDDTQRGQNINSSNTQRGQDIRSSDTQRGQDIRSTDTQRGQDKKGSGNRKIPSAAQIDKMYGESAQMVEDLDTVPNAARAALKGQLLRFVDKRYNDNKDDSYSVIWNTYVDKILSQGVTEIDTGLSPLRSLEDFGVPTFFYNQWASTKNRQQIIRFARDMKYSDEQAIAIADQILN